MLKYFFSLYYFLPWRLQQSFGLTSQHYFQIFFFLKWFLLLNQFILLLRALRLGYLTQDMIDDYEPALMFTIPRLAIVW